MLLLGRPWMHCVGCADRRKHFAIRRSLQVLFAVSLVVAAGRSARNQTPVPQPRPSQSPGTSQSAPAKPTSDKSPQPTPSPQSTPFAVPSLPGPSPVAPPAPGASPASVPLAARTDQSDGLL